MIITAESIDNNLKSIDTHVDEEVAKFVKTRLMRHTRQKKLENPDYALSKEEKDIVKQQILEDDETKAFIEYQRNLQTKKAENYFVVRDTLNNLNELNEFSADMERCGIQTYDKFKTVKDLVTLCRTLSEKKNKHITYRNNAFSEYVRSYENKDLSFTEDDLDLVITMREMYQVTKDTDDLLLFDKYDMQSNLDFANKLGEYYIHKNTDDHNIINDWYNQQSNPVERVMRRIVISNKLLSRLLFNNGSSKHTSFVSNNMVTCYPSMYTTTANNRHTFVLRSLGELLLEITNPELESIDKSKRQQIYSVYDGSRPTSNEYYKWNGLQVFDIDLKEWNQVSVGYIELLKTHLYNELSEYNWFLWVCKSASGKGVHIYTKVTPAHHVYSRPEDNEQLSKYWFNVSYQHKVGIIYDLLYRIHRDPNNQINFGDSNFNEQNELQFLDNVVRRITAGIRLTHDINVQVNNQFEDLHVAIGLMYNKVSDSILFRTSSLNTKLLSLIDNELCVLDNKTNDTPIVDLSQYDFAGEINKIQPLTKNRINYNVRYNVVNTLASLFGKDGLVIAHEVLQSNLCKNEKEINSFYSCALSNKKEPSKLGIDILKECGVIKTVKPDVREYTNNKFKNAIRKAIENSICADTTGVTHTLKASEYLSDLLPEFEGPNGFTNSKINILLSPPGSGKTNMLLTMARQGKRILLVEPFISVIKNKVETDSELMEIFQVFYGDRRLDQLEHGVNAITTFDKFSICNYDKISRMFDYICIDESHLLFTSSYRIEATSSAIRKIKELYYISNNDPFAAKLILMTGTETGDSYFFGDIGNIIKVTKPSLKKELEFLICDDVLDCVTRLSYKAYQLITDGYRLLIPTNKGEIYSHKLIGMIEYLLGRPVKYGYYKRSNIEQEICRLINTSNSIGDYEIVFCSNYLSVGVDIVDNYKFASLYFGPFSGYEIEQFNARIRKTGIYSVYCVQTEMSDGSTNDLLIEEPNLALKLTDEDVERFLDDKQIAKAKQEFIAEYDPVLHKIVTPGFSYLNGAIRFNKEEYDLVSFENKFLEVMIHPTKITRELSKYGYRILVSNEYDSLPLETQEALKKIGIESAREEKIRKHNLLVGTYLDLIDNNYHQSTEGLEFTDIISWIGKHRELIVEDRSIDKCIQIDFNIFAVPTKVTVKSKEALDSMYSIAKYIISKYSVSKAKDIILDYVDDTGILKQKQFKRAMNLMRLVDRADNNELAEPVFKTIEKMYEWLDKFSLNKNYRISYNTYQAELDTWTHNYIDTLGIKIDSQYGFQKIRDNIVEMLNDLAMKNTSKDGIRFDYNRLPDEDGTIAKHKKSVDTMVENMFKIVNDTVTQGKHVRNRNVILVPQGY